MEIVDRLEKSQLNSLRKIYFDFFHEIVSDEYSDSAINSFVNRKVNDVKKVKKDNKYYFGLIDGEVICFIYGKIIDNIGLISHAYMKKDYREKYEYLVLYKKLIEWFKEKEISLIEMEMNVDSPMYEIFEGYNWQIDRSYEDANVYQKKI